MIRETELESYLPPFMAEFSEITAAFTAENPEFRIIWSAADRTLKNAFIDTADEYGISRFEKLLGILPYKEDSLETRRLRVQSRWFSSIPGTLKGLIVRLAVLCGSNSFTIEKYYDSYLIEISIESESNSGFFEQPEELENLLDSLLPCNMRYNNYYESPFPVNINFECEMYASEVPLCGQLSCGQYPFTGGV